MAEIKEEPRIEEVEEVKEDFLEVDPAIPGQKYTCISFVSPEKVIKQKIDFEYYDFFKRIFEDEKVMNQMKECKSFSEFIEKKEDHVVLKKTDIDNNFNELIDFHTSVRGVKIRGTYETEREAKVRAEVLRRRYPNDNVFVGEVGYWLPWDPNPLDVKDLEYQETELNLLMKKYQENMEQREYMFEEEKRTKLHKARAENEKNTVDNDSEHSKKFEEFRDICNEKDKLMQGSDPWMDRKEQDKKDQDINETTTIIEETSDPIPESKEDSEPQPEPEHQPEPEPEPQPEPEPEPQPEPEPEPEPQPEP